MGSFLRHFYTGLVRPSLVRIKIERSWNEKLFVTVQLIVFYSLTTTTWVVGLHAVEHRHNTELYMDRGSIITCILSMAYKKSLSHKPRSLQLNNKVRLLDHHTAVHTALKCWRTTIDGWWSMGNNFLSLMKALQSTGGSLLEGFGLLRIISFCQLVVLYDWWSFECQEYIISTLWSFPLEFHSFILFIVAIK